MAKRKPAQRAWVCFPVQISSPVNNIICTFNNLVLSFQTGLFFLTLQSRNFSGVIGFLRFKHKQATNLLLWWLLTILLLLLAVRLPWLLLRLLSILLLLPILTILWPALLLLLMWLLLLLVPARLVPVLSLIVISSPTSFTFYFLPDHLLGMLYLLLRTLWTNKQLWLYFFLMFLFTSKKLLLWTTMCVKCVKWMKSNNGSLKQV